MKATKLTLAAVLLAGTCGFAMAQGGGAAAKARRVPTPIRRRP